MAFPYPFPCEVMQLCSKPKKKNSLWMDDCTLSTIKKVFPELDNLSCPQAQLAAAFLAIYHKPPKRKQDSSKGGSAWLTLEI